jgi:hypothetical protein
MAKSWWISTPKKSLLSQNMTNNNHMNTKSITLLLFTALLVLLVYYVPILFIWCINTLFETNILYTWTNWFCSLILLMLVGNGSGVSYRKKQIKKETKCCKNK